MLRCNACGHEVMSSKKIIKWTNSARSTIILQKATGMPWNRLADIQRLYGVRVSTSNMWAQCSGVWDDCASFIFDALVEEVSRAREMYTDDTGARILEVIAENKELPKNERRACHTTTVCATRVCPETSAKSEIRLYITDNKYCGENIAPIIEKKYLENPDHYLALIADASSKNMPHIDADLLIKIIIVGCLVHGRRKFFELLDFWPEECRYFIEEIAHIYRIEDECRHMESKKRLRYHKRYSTPHMNNIYKKIRQLFDDRLVEPNSDLGKAMNYWIKNKKSLTMFLRVKGVDLDNNRSERSLKTIIVQRKNSLFFKSRSSAEKLSGLSSIVATCRINGINAQRYLDWIQDNWKSVQKDAKSFLPWDYQAMVTAREQDREKEKLLQNQKLIDARAVSAAA